LFKAAATWLASTGRVISKKINWESRGLICVTFQHLPPDAEENNEDPQLGSPISGSAFFIAGPSETKYNVTYSTVTFAYFKFNQYSILRRTDS
jgi:hypothetical protein